jgi:N-acyl homoserine lactone hydrolase
METMNDVDFAYRNISTVVKLGGKDVKIHALCTGTVAVKKSFKTKKGRGGLSKLSILFDQYYTEYLPIWVYVIEHPEGLIVVDTGETSEITELDTYLKNESAFDRFQFKQAAKFRMKEEDELSYQFDKVKLKLQDVKLVILTHLHLDHTDGLKFFPKQEIIVGSREFDHPNFNMPSTYPAWFKPQRVDYLQNKIDIFNEAYPITSFENLLYVPTPGHTHGNSSLIFRTDNFDLFFAGDCSYTQEQVRNGELAGVNVDFKQTRETYHKIMAYATKNKTIYLPTHDENAGTRLLNNEFLVE